LKEEPDLPFTEEDFRRRKPHPTYKDHLTAEKTVIKFGKTVSFQLNLIKTKNNLSIN
jgi:hypothetical protein